MKTAYRAENRLDKLILLSVRSTVYFEDGIGISKQMAIPRNCKKIAESRQKKIKKD